MPDRQDILDFFVHHFPPCPLGLAKAGSLKVMKHNPALREKHTILRLLLKFSQSTLTRMYRRISCSSCKSCKKELICDVITWWAEKRKGSNEGWRGNSLWM